MNDCHNSGNLADKAGYQRPELTVYGSVRNLTGGSTGTFGDGKTTTRKMML